MNRVGDERFNEINTLPIAGARVRAKRNADRFTILSCFNRMVFVIVIITMRAFDIANECVRYASNYTDHVDAMFLQHLFHSGLVLLKGTRRRMPFAITFHNLWRTKHFLFLLYAHWICVKRKHMLCAYVTVTRFHSGPILPLVFENSWIFFSYLQMIIICDGMLFPRNS